MWFSAFSEDIIFCFCSLFCGGYFFQMLYLLWGSIFSCACPLLLSGACDSISLNIYSTIIRGQIYCFLCVHYSWRRYVFLVESPTYLKRYIFVVGATLFMKGYLFLVEGYIYLRTYLFPLTSTIFWRNINFSWRDSYIYHVDFHSSLRRYFLFFISTFSLTRYWVVL